MNARQLRFIDEYLREPNGTKAATAAGYSARSAHVIASVLLNHVKVSAEISRRQALVAKKIDVTRERVLAELAKIGFANLGDYMGATSAGDPFMDLSKMTRDQSAALGEVTIDDYVDGRGEDARKVKRVKVKLLDKRAALVDLGKHLGLFKDGEPPPTDSNGTSAAVVIKGGMPDETPLPPAPVPGPDEPAT